MECGDFLPVLVIGLPLNGSGNVFAVHGAGEKIPNWRGK